jgi:DNA-binding response OmpR family regulator
VAFVVLAVNANQAELSATKDILESSGYLVVCASDYGEAKQRLALSPPDLLITAVKLGAYNGLQLVIRASANPKMPAIVIGESGDTALKNEAEKLRAVYVPQPVERDSLIALVEQLLVRMAEKAASSAERRWPRKPANIPVQVGECDARLVDASYGGLRLEFSGPPSDRPQRIDAVSISRVGSVSIHPVWTRGGLATPSVWWCGVEVTPAERKSGSPWRTFVDSLH